MLPVPDFRLGRCHRPRSRMLELLLWVGVGGLVGSLVGIYRYSDGSKARPKFGAIGHISSCVAIGALASSLLFAATVSTPGLARSEADRGARRGLNRT